MKSNIYIIVVAALLLVSCGASVSGPVQDVMPKKAYAKAIAEYDNLSDEFVDGVCWVSKNSMYGAINAKGVEVIPCKYEDIVAAGEGLLIFELDNKYGYVNQKGEEVVPAKYYRVGEFNDGLAIVATRDESYNYHYGYINTNGEEIIPLKYESATEFSSGLAAVYVKDKDAWGYINAKNEFVIEPIYDDANIFSDGLAIVRKNSKDFAINNKGEYIVSLKSNEEFWAENYSCGLIPIFREKGNKLVVVYLNTAGEDAFAQEYHYGEEFEDDKAMVLLDNKVAYIDTKGNVLEETPDPESIAEFLDDALRYASKSVVFTAMKAVVNLLDGELQEDWLDLLEDYGDDEW